MSSVLTVEKLKELLELHKVWLEDFTKGKRLNLSVQDLRNPEIVKVLNNADLRGANFIRANLSNADLSFTNLEDADLRYANLSNADLRFANLKYAKLNNADLYNVDLRFAYLYNADLRLAENIPFIRLACPDTGSFIGWKKVNNYIIKLEIPSKAKRSSATTNKCRCEYAKVLEIQNIDGSKTNIKKLINTEYAKCVYKVGKIVYPDSFDENRWNECSNGIHFFINRQEAIMGY